MTRAGREPAEDVKRRLVNACQEAGLVVTHATMRLLQQADARLIYVGASFPDWPYESPTVGLMATVPVTGRWPESIDIRCCATEGDPALISGPLMRGRTNAPFIEIVEQLQATLTEREQVITAVKAGIAGPYRFEHSVWHVVDLLKDLAPPNDTSP
jgi:hypothetical protein